MQEPHHYRKTPNQVAQYFKIDGEVLSKRLAALARSSKNSEPTISCPEQDCNEKFQTDAQLRRHKRNVHEPNTWVHKPCERGCQPDKIYSTSAAYETHMGTYHSGKWPIACRVEDCRETKMFNSASKYSKHLQYAYHRSSAESRKEYFPQRTEWNEKLEEQWGPSQCPIMGCKTKTIWKVAARFGQHMKRSHYYDQAQASAAAKALYKTCLVKRTQTSSRRRTNKM